MTKETSENTAIELGKLIKEARLNSGIDLFTLSEKLRLPVDTIEKIEADAFSELPGDTYVRAYIKTLAEEFVLDKDELLEKYYRITKQTPASQSVQTINFDTSGSSIEVKSKQNYGKLALVSLFIVIAALLFKLFIGDVEQEEAVLEIPQAIIDETLKSDSLNQVSTLSDSLLKDSLDQIVETDSTIANLLTETDSVSTEVDSAEIVVDKGTTLKIRMKKDSTWYLIKSKGKADEARWIRTNQGTFQIKRKDTVYVEFGTIRNVDLHINNQLVNPKRNIFKVFNGELIGE